MLFRFADILTQMLGSKDNSEASHVRSSLTALLKIDPAGTLKGVFNQVSTIHFDFLLLVSIITYNMLLGHVPHDDTNLMISA